MSNHTGLAALALIALVLGMNHSTDPDHVVAVTAILSRERRIITSARIGIVWGLGHSATVMAVGIAIIVLKVSIPARLGLLMEFAVALMLIVLGLSSTREVIRALVRRFVRRPPSPEPALIHSHRHSHGDFEHSHPHLHRHAHETDATTAHDHLAQMQASAPPRRPLLQSFGVGLVHGMAGSAAIALLALSAIPYPAWAVLYLTVFCLGTIIGMLLITTALATPFVFAAARVSQLHRGLQAGAGLLSFAFGAFIAWQVGINDHLFGALPNWTPH